LGSVQPPTVTGRRQAGQTMLSMKTPAKRDAEHKVKSTCYQDSAERCNLKLDISAAGWKPIPYGIFEDAIKSFRGGGGGGRRAVRDLARLMSAPEIAATFGVGGLPVGGRAHIISRTVKLFEICQLFGQGEGNDGNPDADTVI